MTDEELTRLYETGGARAVFKAGLSAGFDVAREHAEISEHNGWHRTSPTIEWYVAEAALRAARGETICPACKGEGYVKPPADSVATARHVLCEACKATGVIETTT